MRRTPARSRFAIALTALWALASCSHKTWVAQYEGGTVELSPYERELALGANRYQLRRYDEAEKHLREAEKEAQDDNQKARARAARGAVALSAGDPARAEKLLRQAIQWDATVGDAWVHLARVSLARADTLGAIGVLDEGRRRAPQDAQVEAVLGRVYYYWGGYEQAVLHLERALAKHPGKAEWERWLAEARVGTGAAPDRAGAQDSVPAPASRGEAPPAVPSFDPPEEPDAARFIPMGPITHDPTPEDLARLESRARRARRAAQLRRADFAVLLAAYGPLVRPWPNPRDLPPDAIDHPDAPYLAIALLGRWLRPDLEGLVRPDSMLTRATAALLLEPQVRRYPALMRLARELPEVPDVPYDSGSYEAIASVVASGLLPLASDGRFRPEAPFTGEEGAAVAERLRAAVQAQGSSGAGTTEGTGGGRSSHGRLELGPAHGPGLP